MHDGPGATLPQLPQNLPPLQDLLRALPPLDASGLNAALPALQMLKLPPPQEIVKVLESAAQVGGAPRG